MSRKTLLAVILIGVTLVAAAGVGVYQARQEPPPSTATRLDVGGRSLFWAGLNYPWHNYQDFGSGPWGHSGVSNATSYAEIDTDFANMAAQGVKIAKWRVFNDGRYSPKFDERGYVTGFDDRFYDDVDKALEIARKYDIYLVLSLFSSSLWTTDCEKNGVRLGVGPGILADGGRRKSLVEKAVIPLLQHIGPNDHVLAYEIIAEPEWGVYELRDKNSDRKTVPLNAARAFVKDAAKAVHKYTNAYVSVQSNRPTYMRHWRGLGLDYYSFSWYDWMEPYDPLDVPATTYRLDKPVVIGEFPVAESQYYDFAQVIDIAYRQGYAGAFAWSYSAGDKYSRWTSVAKTYTEWVGGIWPEVDVSGVSVPPTPDSLLKPQPYVYFDPQLSAEGNAADVSADVQIREGGVYIIKFYLYEFGGAPPGTELQQVALFRYGERQQFSLHFPDLAEGQRYKLSLAIYSSSQDLLKWVDSYAVFDLKEGGIEVPSLSDEVVGNPCSQ